MGGTGQEAMKVAMGCGTNGFVDEVNGVDEQRNDECKLLYSFEALFL